MAKKIRFPLQMKDGFSVRTLEELREHFDLESVLGYFADGKLKTWLADRYYDEMAQKVDALSADMPDLNAQLCGIIGVEYSELEDDTDFEALQRRQEKLRVLREVTDDQQILDNVDAVAFDQDELFDILDEAPAVIYLYGEKFSIPYAKGGITYIGVNNPEVSLEKNELEYKKNGITLQRIRFANKSDAVSVEVAKELIDQERYDEALPIVKQLAEDGDAVAQLYLGWMYNNGQGVTQDNVISEEWYRKAAMQGNPTAQFYLGCMFERGDVHKQDYVAAVKWYRKAAEQGDVDAQYNLGCCYLSGNGINQDSVEAAEWFQRAADQNDSGAQCNLGLMYEQGNGVEQNDVIAFELFQQAAEQGNTWAQSKIGLFYRRGIGVEQDYALALKWFQKAAEEGFEWAQINLGEMYLNGEGVEASEELAIQWFEKAADEGNSEAQYKLGCIYYDDPDDINHSIFTAIMNAAQGIETPQRGNNEMAIKWFHKAALQENAEAQEKIGEMYYYSMGVKQDYYIAKEWFQKAAENGNIEAMRWLGSLYAEGKGVPRDRLKAIEWFQKAVDAGDESPGVKYSIIRLESQRW